MNYYERIQQAIDYMEERLTEDLVLEEVARAAYMSPANLYRLFFALTGHTVKEYVRCRRLSVASYELADGQAGILETALRYGFESGEAFSRAFRRAAGMLPSESKRRRVAFEFGRANVVERYIGIQDAGLAEKYPEIKVLKELPPQRVAACRYYGKDPETGAWRGLAKWLKKDSGLHTERDGLRFFGFNNPNPQEGQEEYGYVVWVTLPEDYVERGEGVRFMTSPGGLYAVMNVKGGGEALPAAWKRFGLWLSESKYVHGSHLWLEEHLGVNEEFEHLGSIDLYLPIAPGGPDGRSRERTAE
ncbi:AraC family transcriptional regulator [Gorillibacterium sp. sgz5001074]|uniref:AraC family transcriptional regulator n=1 Tax=Gorillibacterium sp. sgz5001074 TaxID=3446695 RepID=UPI003F671A16